MIDSEGNLIDIIHPNNLKQIKDKTNGLTREVENTNKTALSEFEKDAIRLLSEIKKWRIKKHIKTNGFLGFPGILLPQAGRPAGRGTHVI